MEATPSTPPRRFFAIRVPAGRPKAEENASALFCQIYLFGALERIMIDSVTNNHNPLDHPHWREFKKHVDEHKLEIHINGSIFYDGKGHEVAEWAYS